MSNIQTGAERMPHDLSHLGFLAGQIGRLITISTTPVIAGDSFEMDAVGALRLSPLRRGLAIDSTVDIFTFYVPHRHVYGEQWIKFMKDGVNATPLPTVNTTGYIDHAAFLGTINPDTNKIPKHLFQGYLNIYNNYFKAPWMPDRTEANPNELNQDDARYGFRCCHLKNIWTAPLPPETELSRQMTTSTTSIDIMGLQAAYANLHTDQERDYFMQRYHDVISSFGGKTSYDADNRPLLVMRSNLWASGYDVDGTDQTSLGQFSGRVQQTYKHSVPRFFVPEHGTMFTLALVRFPPTATKEIPYLNAKGAFTYTDIAGDPVLYGNLPPRGLSMKDVFRSGASCKNLKQIGSAAGGMAELREAVTRAEGAGYLATELRARNNLAWLVVTDDPRTGLETARAAVALATTMGVGDMAVQLAEVATAAAVDTGEWDWALDTIDELEAGVVPEANRINLAALVATIRALRGQDDPMHPIRRMEPLPADTDPQVRAGVDFARAWEAFVRGDFATARELASGAAEVSFGTDRFREWSLAVRASLWLGDRAGAAEALARLEAKPVRGRATQAELATLLAGLAALDADDGARASYDRAAETFRELELPLHLALCQLDAHRLLREEHAPAEAVRALQALGADGLLRAAGFGGDRTRPAQSRRPTARTASRSDGARRRRSATDPPAPSG